MMDIIEYVVGDATEPKMVDGPNYIVHGCNNKGGWGKGFVLALSNKWKTPEGYYRKWHHYGHHGNNPFDLGEIQITNVDYRLFVVNLISQDGYKGDGSTSWASSPAKLWAINKGLSLLRNTILTVDFASYREAAIHMPRIGCGLGGLEWEQVEREIEKVFRFSTKRIKIYVYDLPE